uniref:Cupin type-1 domain-containing protein n=1 Tax=Populus alba TaxID=43335 RepID=A0A4U5PMP2_POPAL|nr:hypothetical protein D5086_0000203320 [Populus alba]
MEGLKFLIVFVVLALASSFASALDPSPLQDFCVAIKETDGGNSAKDPQQVTEKDFFFSGLNVPRDSFSPVGSNVTAVNSDSFHFQLNVGKTNAVALASLSSQNPGVITIANAVFGADPPINPNVLTKAFHVDKKVVDYLQKQFWTDNNN